MTVTDVPSPLGFGTHRPAPRPELIAPGSALHTLLCDASIATYVLPIFVMPLLHPATAAATGQYDSAFHGERPHVRVMARRLWDTMEMVAGIVYAGPEAATVSTAMRELHRDIGGTLPSGQSYHAWTKETWRWNWAAITAAVLDVYDGTQGFPDQQFGEDAYLGLVEVGRTFAVVGMPSSYAVFRQEWPELLDRVADTGTETLHMVTATHRPSGFSRPPSLKLLPQPLWDLALTPVCHLLRISMRIGVPRHLHVAMGLPESDGDERWVRVHRAVWRAIPRRLSHTIGRRVLEFRLRRAAPVWRTRFSPEALGARRG